MEEHKHLDIKIDKKKMEEWRQIETSPLYEVSNLGNVRHKTRQNILKARGCCKKGDYVCFQVNIADATGKQRNQKVHQLVALAFIPNPENKKEIDHIDRNTANNRVDNLRWSNRSEQAHNSRTRKDNALGERNIHHIEGRASPYKVLGTRMPTRFFKTLEEAVAYRDRFF